MINNGIADYTNDLLFFSAATLVTGIHHVYLSCLRRRDGSAVLSDVAKRARNARVATVVENRDSVADSVKPVVNQSGTYPSSNTCEHFLQLPLFVLTEVLICTSHFGPGNRKIRT